MRVTAAMLAGAGAFGLTAVAASLINGSTSDFEPIQMAKAQEAATFPKPSLSPVQYRSPFLPPQPASVIEPAPQDDPASGWQSSTPVDENRCETAIEKAEQKYHLPRHILLAIAITESGRESKPRPWAMNIQGTPHIAKGPAEMKAIVERYGSDASIDVGCAQVNLRWHGGRFESWESLLDPDINVDYAAFHLVELKKELGTWGRAVSAYHSRTNWRGANYACTVSRNYGQLLGDMRKGCGPNIDALTAYLTKSGWG